MNIQVLPDAEAMAREAVGRIISAAKEALTYKNFQIAFSGGSTPRRTYELLSEAPIEWGRVEVFGVDERFVPNTDPNSNEKLVRDALLSKVCVPENQIFPMVTAATPAECATDYERLLRTINPRTRGFSEREMITLDLAIMGIGPDGHTASLFPGIPELEERSRWVVPTLSPAGVRERISLTVPALAQVSRLLFLVEGEGKREAFRKIQQREKPLLPGALVDEANPNSLWLVTQDVISELVPA